MTKKTLTALAALCAGLALAETDPAFSPGYFWMWSHALDAAKLVAQLEDMRTH